MACQKRLHFFGRTGGIFQGFLQVMTSPAGRVRRRPNSCGGTRDGSRGVPYLMGRIRSDMQVFKSHASGRVGSGRVGSGRVGSGRVRLPFYPTRLSEK